MDFFPNFMFAVSGFCGQYIYTYSRILLAISYSVSKLMIHQEITCREYPSKEPLQFATQNRGHKFVSSLLMYIQDVRKFIPKGIKE